MGNSVSLPFRIFCHVKIVKPKKEEIGPIGLPACDDRGIRDWCPSDRAERRSDDESRRITEKFSASAAVALALILDRSEACDFRRSGRRGASAAAANTRERA